MVPAGQRDGAGMHSGAARPEGWVSETLPADPVDRWQLPSVVPIAANGSARRRGAALWYAGLHERRGDHRRALLLAVVDVEHVREAPHHPTDCWSRVALVDFPVEVRVALRAAPDFDWDRAAEDVMVAEAGLWLVAYRAGFAVADVDGATVSASVHGDVRPCHAWIVPAVSVEIVTGARCWRAPVGAER